MTLSIVIPVYRVETTLNRCVESVISQSYADFELILVDDGSPDNCPQICDEWAQKDRRINVIHKQNGGLSDARNAGIDQAKGEYITFIDSDDYIQAGTLLLLMNTLEDNPAIDLLEYPAYIHYGSARQHLLTFPQRNCYDKMNDYWYLGRAYQHTYAWNKIYRRSLFDGVRYPVGVLFEDVHTLPLLLSKANCVATTDKGLYYYCQNEKGITSTADGRALKMLLEAHLKVINHSQREDGPAYYYYLHVLNIQMDVYELTGEAPTLPFRKVRTGGIHGILKLKARLHNLLGTKRLCKTNKIIHKVWRNH